MRFIAALITFAAFSMAPFSAAAEVSSASPSAFMIEAEADIAATPDQVWRALMRVERWWSPAHTYSGDARRLSLEPRAGGCWCERWDMGSRWNTPGLCW